jgi:outer membrane biosynthesis protein TonB
MKKIIVFFFLGFLFSAVSAGLIAQEKPQATDDSISSSGNKALPAAENKPDPEQQPKEKEVIKPKVEPVKKEVVKKPEPVKEVKKNKPDEPKKNEKIQNNNDDKITEQGLLHINDDFIKLSRIPGIKIKKPSASDKDNIIKVSDSSLTSSSSSDSMQPKGLFGLSKRATDVLAVSSIIFLIAVIFILYRSRTRSPRRKKTLRNYSKTIISSRKK